MAFEMIAAVIAVLTLDELLPEPACIRHFVDNTAAKQCIIVGHSKKPDHNDIVGILWHCAAHRATGYWCEWVQTKANLADGPSRKDFSLMKRLGATEIKLDFNRFIEAADTWKINPSEDRLVRQA